MNIQRIKLPPVSLEFYNTLVEMFPPLNPLDIKEDTPMIYIQRRAAQQEVLNMIESVVRETEGKLNSSIWDKFSFTRNKEK